MRTRLTMGWRGRVLLLGALLAPLMAPPAAAQTTSGNIRGFVRNPGGEALAGATVLARELSTNLQRGALTSPAGFYYLPGLRPGRWALTVQMLGHATRSDTLNLMVGQTLQADFTLGEEAVALEALTVTATPVQETRTQAIVTDVTRQEIANLPTRDRNVLDLAGLAPGIQVSRSTNAEKSFRAGAQPAEQVNVFVDGASYKNDVLRNGVAGQDASKGNPFPQGAIQEFRVLTQNFKAEYQMAGSAIITAVTRSGTNEWEGSLFGYNICRGCVGKDAIAVRDKLTGPDFHRFQAGGSVGGPIKRDRIFVFGTYEYNDRNSPVSVVPGTGTIPGVDLNQYRGLFQNNFKEHLGFGKLTFTPGSRHTLDVSTNYRHENELGGFGGQTAYTAREDIAQDIVTSTANYKFAGAKFLNEAQVTFQNYQWQPHPTSTGVVHNYFGIVRFGPKDSRQTFTQRRISLRDDFIPMTVRWNGEHVFKVGANTDFLRYRAEKFFNINPVVNFDPGLSLTTPAWADVGYGTPDVATNNVQFGAYVQDDWTITPKLLLNLGVRWDAETNAYNNDHVTPQTLRDSLTGPLSSKLDPQVLSYYPLTDYFSNGRSSRPIYLKAFQPRAGITYDFQGNNRTVAFGGAGLYFDRDFWNLFFDEDWRRQFSVRSVCFLATWCPTQATWNDSYLSNPEALRALAVNKGGGSDAFLVNNKTVPPRTLQFTAGVRQAIGENVLLTASYAGARGYHLLAWVRGNSDWGNVGPSYNNILLSMSDGKTFFDSFILQAQKPFRERSRWGGSLAYTLGWAKSKGSTDCCFPFIFDFRYKVPQKMPKLAIPGDNRHQIVASGIVRVPYDALVSGILTLRSGTAAQANDYSHLTSYADLQAIPYVFYPPKHSFLGISNAFAEQYFDMRVEKGFSFQGNRVAAQLDLFNVFNSPNWGCYNATIPPQGQTNADLGKPGCAGEARRLQFGLRYDLSTRKAD